jgi:hypothetical protein
MNNLSQVRNDNLNLEIKKERKLGNVEATSAVLCCTSDEEKQKGRKGERENKGK